MMTGYQLKCRWSVYCQSIFDRVLIELLIEMLINGIDQHLTMDAFSTYDLT